MDPLADEFLSLEDMMEEVGLPRTILPRGRRRTTPVSGDRTVSSIAWGNGSPEIVFLHGGGQNAHTWDLVVTLLGRPALAIDLPGHGHSSWRADQDYSPTANAEAVIATIREFAPEAKMVVGMSLGGMTAINLAARWPGSVPRLALVDILPTLATPIQELDRSQLGAVALVSGPRVFERLEDMIAAAVAASPSRPESATRRGVVNNSMQLPDGTWRWRYDELKVDMTKMAAESEALWDDLAGLSMPVLLATGDRSGFVASADIRRFEESQKHPHVLRIANAGHSIQGDQPVALAASLAWFLSVQES